MAIVRLCPGCGVDIGPWSSRKCGCGKKPPTQEELDRERENHYRYLGNVSRMENCLQQNHDAGLIFYRKLVEGYVVDDMYYKSIHSAYKKGAWRQYTLEFIENKFYHDSSFIESLYNFYVANGYLTDNQYKAARKYFINTTTY